MASRSRHLLSSRWVLGFCALALVVSSAALASSTTTVPGKVFTLRVVLTDSNVQLMRNKTGPDVVLHDYIRPDGTAAQFPRGTLVKFLFVNEGTKTYLPAIRITNNRNANPYNPGSKRTFYKANAIKPGGHTSLFGNFYYRGAFRIEKLFHNKPQGQPVKISIY